MSDFIKSLKSEVTARALVDFKNHKIAELHHVPWKGDYQNQYFVARVMSPKTWIYGFYISILPGCIHVWGDIGSTSWTQVFGGRASIAWLRNAVNSLSYLAEKQSRPDREKNEVYYPELAKEYMAELKATDPEDDPSAVAAYEALKQNGIPEDGPEYGRIICDVCDDGDFYRSTYHSHQFLFTVEAIKKFIELYDAAYAEPGGVK